MRLLIPGLLALAVALPARADDPSAFKELLDKAVKAQGGAEKAAKTGEITLKGKGTVNEGGMSAEFAMDLSLKEFDHVRADLTIMVGGMTKKGTIVLAGGKGWFRDADGNKTEEAPAEVLPLIQSFVVCLSAPAMPARLGARKDLTLAHGGEGKIDDATAEVLRITRKDQPEITVYYDKKTGLPLKSEAQLKENPGGQEVPFEFRYSEFKEIEGLKLYTKVKITKDGKDMFELELSDIKPGAKFDANTFDRP